MLSAIEAAMTALEQSGLGSQVASWLGNGQNLPVSVDQLRNALGEENLGQLASQVGLPAEDLLRHLADHLPGAIDAMSPKGSLEKDLGLE